MRSSRILSVPLEVHLPCRQASRRVRLPRSRAGAPAVPGAWGWPGILSPSTRVTASAVSRLGRQPGSPAGVLREDRFPKDVPGRRLTSIGPARPLRKVRSAEDKIPRGPFLRRKTGRVVEKSQQGTRKRRTWASRYCFFAVKVPSAPATAIVPFMPPSSPSVPVNTRW